MNERHEEIPLIHSCSQCRGGSPYHNAALKWMKLCVSTLIIALFVSNAWRFPRFSRVTIENRVQVQALQEDHAVHQFWWLTDVHLDLGYDPRQTPQSPQYICRNHQLGVNSSTRSQSFPWGRINCDPPLKLLQSQLRAMHSLDPAPKALLVTGDMLAHFLPNSDIAAETLRVVASQFALFFSKVQVVFTLGNVDMQLVDAHVDFYQQYSTLASLYKQIGWLRESEVASFSKGGFYSRHLDQSLSFLVLNTNLVVDRPNIDRWSPAAQSMLDWLQVQLSLLRKSRQRAIIIGHAAPGSKVQAANWFPEATASFSELCARYADVILLQIFGDYTEAVEFRMIWDQKDRVAVPILVSPGTTPRRPAAPGTNPVFEQITYSPHRQAIDDVQRWIFDLQRANFMDMMRDEYSEPQALWTAQKSFRSHYGVTQVDASNLEKVWNRLVSNYTALSEHFRWQWPKFATNRDFAIDLCDMRFLQNSRSACYADPGAWIRA